MTKEKLKRIQYFYSRIALIIQLGLIAIKLIPNGQLEKVSWIYLTLPTSIPLLGLLILAILWYGYKVFNAIGLMYKHGIRKYIKMQKHQFKLRRNEK